MQIGSILEQKLLIHYPVVYFLPQLERTAEEMTGEHVRKFVAEEEKSRKTGMAKLSDFRWQGEPKNESIFRIQKSEIRDYRERNHDTPRSSGISECPCPDHLSPG